MTVSIIVKSIGLVNSFAKKFHSFFLPAQASSAKIDSARPSFTKPVHSTPPLTNILHRTASINYLNIFYSSGKSDVESVKHLKDRRPKRHSSAYSFPGGLTFKSCMIYFLARGSILPTSAYLSTKLGCTAADKRLLCYHTFYLERVLNMKHTITFISSTVRRVSLF